MQLCALFVYMLICLSKTIYNNTVHIWTSSVFVTHVPCSIHQHHLVTSMWFHILAHSLSDDIQAGSASLTLSRFSFSLLSAHTHSCHFSVRAYNLHKNYVDIWLRPTKSGPVGLKKLTFHTFHHVQYNGCFKHMNYRLSMSNKPCHTIFFSFRMVGL